jgi:diguanylate cyclase (GGDEF)-like protein/PAS domain S-box-containing protein
MKLLRISPDWNKQLIALLVIICCSLMICWLFIFPLTSAKAENESTPILTFEERTWLRQNPEKLVLYYNVEFPPIEFSSPDGLFIGMGADVVKKVEEFLGVQFIRIPSTDWNDHLRALESGECAIAPTIVKTPARDEYAFFTTPYATAPVVIITDQGITGKVSLDDLAGLKIAVVSGYATEKYLMDQALLNDFEVIPVANVPQGLYSLSFNEIDAFVENLAVAAYYIDYLSIPNLRIAGETDYSFAWSIGISRKYPFLFSSIQKALDQIEASDMAEIKGKWITLETDFGLTDETLRLIRMSGLFLVMLLFGLTAITFFLRKQLAQTVTNLQESENKFRGFVEHSNDIIFTLNDKGKLTYVSPSWKTILGHEEDEVIGQLYTTFIHEDDVARSLELQQKVIEEKKQTGSLEYRVRCKDGQVRWHAANGSLIEKDGRYSYVGVARDITESKQVEEKIRYMSMHDSLTNLYNRNYLETEMARLDTKRQLPISIIMADVNGLKLINDTYGHEKGDQLLIAAAGILSRSCRDEDILSRWGGDEFVILLPQTDQDEAWKICKRINRSCADADFDELPVSIATGVACKVDQEKNLNEVLREAEDAMYKNKLTESRSTKSAIVETLLKTLAAKSYETEVHTRGMQDIAQKIGKKMNLPETELRRLDLLIILHDIGKINLPEELLTKPEPLLNSEWEEIHKHPEIGFRIARATEEFAHVAEEILAHHERWDGSGYPRGLKGEKIPLLSRIAAVADAYEVMKNGRPYKNPMNRDKILQEFKHASGTQFDPNIVEIIITLIDHD